MNIESMASDMKQVQLQQQVSMRVLDKAIDNSKLQGQGIQKLIDSAPMPQDPLLGQNVDILV